MNRYPVSIAGLGIMLTATIVGFVPTLWSILLFFATTLLGGHLIKKHAEESYDGFIKMFGVMTVIFNIVAAGMVMLLDMDYIQKSGAVFLHMMVIMIILTLFKVNNNGGKEGRDN